MFTGFFGRARLLSFDILLGVLAGYLFACTLLESNVPTLVPVILCLVVWMVYTLDHLGDAYFLGDRAVKAVYKWHRQNRKHLLYAVAILACSCLPAS